MSSNITESGSDRIEYHKNGNSRRRIVVSSNLMLETGECAEMMVVDDQGVWERKERMAVYISDDAINEIRSQPSYLLR